MTKLKAKRKPRRKAKGCNHCYHFANERRMWQMASLHSESRTCCHCGADEMDEHGPHHPAKARAMNVLPAWTIINNTTTSGYADGCSCNPKNGGSGVCNCIKSGNVRFSAPVA